MTYSRSKDYYRSASIIAGASLTRSKAPGRLFPIGSGPLYATGGSGAVLYDADGHEFIDLIAGLGAISLGYNYFMDSFFGRDLDGVYSLPHVQEVLTAETMLRVVAPWATSCRFVKTGSESLAAAVMIARKATGRRWVLVAEGSYHGWLPWTSQRGQVCTDGEFTATYAYGTVPDPETHANIAAVIVEPSRWHVTPPGYLFALQTYAHRIGALFVVDEMIYGCRWEVGGATAREGLNPDIACYGKAIGNGAPIACLVGGDLLREHGEMISGTYSGEVGSLMAVDRVLKVYKSEPVIATLWERGLQLADGLEAAIDGTGWNGRVERQGAAVHQRLVFAGDDPANPAQGKRFCAEMASHGILFHPQVINIMAAHSVQQIAQVCEAAGASLEAMA